MDHALATKGAAYLLMPQDEMNFLNYYSFDVIFVWLSLLVVTLWVIFIIIRAVFRVILGLATGNQRKTKTQ